MAVLQTGSEDARLTSRSHDVSQLSIITCNFAVVVENPTVPGEMILVF